MSYSFSMQGPSTVIWSLKVPWPELIIILTCMGDELLNVSLKEENSDARGLLVWTRRVQDTMTRKLKTECFFTVLPF